MNHRHDQQASGVRRIARWTFCAPLLAAGVACPPAWGVAFIGYDGSSVTNLIATPDRIYSWDVGVPITWKMDEDFRIYFQTDALQDQVRLAFKEWEDASTSVIKRANPNYTWRRYNGQQDFLDLRTVINHELGHVLGSQHTDASWFNSNLMSNFLPDGNGGWIAGKPLGGELMNEGNKAGFLPNSKPPKGLQAGEVHRLVSQDELAMLDHAYNGPLDFVEVGPDDEANIVLTMHNLGGVKGNNLGNAGIAGWEWRDENDPDAGRRITGGSLSLNANPTTPMGMKARAAKWEFTNSTGQDVVDLTLQARGTDNRKAVGVSSSGIHKFTHIAAENVIVVPHLEDTLHVYSNPLGGTVPNGSKITVGLQLDTWDWKLVDADAKTSDNSHFDVNLVTIFDWNNNGDPLPPIPGTAITFDFIAADPDGLPSASFERLAGGFRIVNAAATATTVSQIAFAAVPGMDPTLENLGLETMDELAAAGNLQVVTFSPIVLDPNEEFIFALDGTIDDLPTELVASGNYMLLNMPHLGYEMLFVYAASGTAASPAEVGNFTFVNTPLYVPEPGSLALGGVGWLFSLGLVRRRHKQR